MRIPARRPGRTSSWRRIRRVCSASRWPAPGRRASSPLPDRYAPSMARAVIVSAVRTPFGKLGGAFKDYEAPQLGAVAIRAALERIGLEGSEVDYVIMGEVLQAGVGQAPARQAAVGAGLPVEVP